MFRRLFILTTWLFCLTAVTLFLANPVPTQAQSNGCIIPESGPWPPCATGGNSTTPPDPCVIPPSGPWPPCATGGESTGNTPPIIESFRLYYRQEGNRVNIYKYVDYKDADGDAIFVDWEITDVVSGNPNNITIRDGAINAPANIQKAGATAIGRFQCAPNDTTTLLNMKVTIVDRQGNESNTIYFQNNCGGMKTDKGDCIIPTSGPWPPCATNGGNQATKPECIIPDSGPWPPCATGGVTATQPVENLSDCSIYTATGFSTQECSVLLALRNSLSGLENQNDWFKGWFNDSTPICNWTGITCDSTQTHIIELTLHNLGLSGSLPAKLGNLSHLQRLDISTNKLSGSIPSELGNLDELEIIYLGFNNLSGSVPAQLGNLSNLRILALAYNDLSGIIPPELGELTKLYYLRLDDNNLIGSIPTQLGNMYELRHLLLDNNQLTGSVPQEIGNLMKLRLLSLSTNNLSGTIPSELGNLHGLTQLGLSENNLTGSIPESFLNLKAATHVSETICLPQEQRFIDWWNAFGRHSIAACS